MKRHARVAWQVIDEQAVLMDLERGKALGLNATGSFLWERLEEKTREELAAELAEAFATEPARALRDVAGFIDVLQERGFVEE